MMAGTWRATRWGAATLVALALTLPGPLAAAPSSAAERANRALVELRVEDAARILESAPDDPETSYVRALLHFHRGDYRRALKALDRSVRAAPPSHDDDRTSLRELIQATHDTVEHFEETRSEDGRFVVRHAPGPDAVLVPYALEAMRAADEALTEQLGLRVPGPVLLEVYPTPSTLAQVSTLSVEAITRTGTIALCKWDRLMVTSPRALVRGYPWMDTIAHEYVHLVLSRASRDRAPVWFQEGVAKFLERTWRGEEPRAQLDPASEGLLRQATREGELIAFNRLHPSIALLPSQRDAALAFAQVATFFESFHAQQGAEGLQRAIARIAEGEDARRALARVAGTSFRALEKRWKTALADRPEPEVEPPPLQHMRFKKGEHMDPSLEVETEQARRHLRLGDLLWDRNRPGAAKHEYAKAHRAAPGDPIVASRLARAALAAGDPDAALRAIDTVVARYPDHAPAHAVRGSALLAKGDLRRSARASAEAIRLNPFDPRPHCDLVMSAPNDQVRRRERAQCRRLGGQAAR